MADKESKITVYYDGACPQCVRDRKNYESLEGEGNEPVCWFDITDREEALQEIGIDPDKALRELYISDESGKILSEIDAYIVLMRRVALLKPLAWLIGLPFIRPALSYLYHWWVNRRLRREGRI